MTCAGQDTFVPMPDLTADKVREARRLLGWYQVDLAFAARIGLSTLANFEVGLPVRPATRGAIMTALSAAGIVVDRKGQVRLLRRDADA